MKLFKNFMSDRRGGLAITTGLAMVPMLMLVGMGVEYTWIQRERTALQSMADAAALAAIRVDAKDTDDLRKARAENLFNASTKQRNLEGAKAQFAIKGDGIVATASYQHPMVFRLLADNVDIEVRSEVNNPSPPGRVLDIVMCIDATTSMGTVIDQVRQNAKNFPDDLQAELKTRNIGEFNLMRTKVIYFRDIVFWKDFFSNGSVWAESKFFSFPQELGSFRQFLTDNGAGGQYNYDIPESSNECLYKAMTSAWTKVGDPIPATADKPATTTREVMPVVILWTDANPKPVNDALSRASPANPAGMPDTDAAFTAVWNDPKVIDQKNKMFILFGPCSNPAWLLGMNLQGATCGGSVYEGSSYMVRKIADAMAKVSKSQKPFLSN